MDSAATNYPQRLDKLWAMIKCSSFCVPLELQEKILFPGTVMLVPTSIAVPSLNLVVFVCSCVGVCISYVYMWVIRVRLCCMVVMVPWHLLCRKSFSKIWELGSSCSLVWKKMQADRASYSYLPSLLPIFLQFYFIYYLSHDIIVWEFSSHLGGVCVD